MITNIVWDVRGDQEWLFNDLIPHYPNMNGKSVLQIGARGDGAISIFRGFQSNGFNRFHVLEVWEPNYRWCRLQPIKIGRASCRERV